VWQLGCETDGDACCMPKTFYDKKTIEGEKTKLACAAQLLAATAPAMMIMRMWHA